MRRIGVIIFRRPGVRSNLDCLCLRETVTPCQPTFPPTASVPSTLSQCIDRSAYCCSEHGFPFCNDPRMWRGLQAAITDINTQFFPQPLFTIHAATASNGRNAAPTIRVQNSDFPAPVPNFHHNGTLFERSYGVPVTDIVGTNSARPVTTIEILRTFSFPTSIIAAR
jgi:hypothetical protein